MVGGAPERDDKKTGGERPESSTAGGGVNVQAKGGHGVASCPQSLTRGGQRVRRPAVVEWPGDGDGDCGGGGGNTTWSAPLPDARGRATERAGKPVEGHHTLSPSRETPPSPGLPPRPHGQA